MNRYLLVFATIFAVGALSSEPALAAKKRNRTTADQVKTTQAAPAAGANKMSGWGLGVTTIGTDRNTGVIPVSAMFNFGEQHSVQALLSLPTTAGGFNFNAGGIYRNAAVGSRSEGLHIGGGFIIGNQAGGGAGGGSVFMADIAGVVGAHFTVGKSVLISADAGPVLSIADGNASFQLGGLSQILGLSLHYMF